MVQRELPELLWVHQSLQWPLTPSDSQPSPLLSQQGDPGTEGGQGPQGPEVSCTYRGAQCMMTLALIHGLLWLLSRDLRVRQGGVVQLVPPGTLERPVLLGNQAHLDRLWVNALVLWSTEYAWKMERLKQIQCIWQLRAHLVWLVHLEDKEAEEHQWVVWRQLKTRHQLL